MQNTLTPAIIGHLVGDYLLQNDWMALNKKSSSFACAVHYTLWTLAVCAFFGWWTPIVFTVLWITHFIQDRTSVVLWWMRFNRQSKFTEPPMSPCWPVEKLRRIPEVDEGD